MCLQTFAFLDGFSAGLLWLALRFAIEGYAQQPVQCFNKTESMRNRGREKAEAHTSKKKMSTYLIPVPQEQGC